MKRIFLSYSRHNQIFAERLARDLDDAGLEVWVDFRKIQGGDKWQDQIFRGISQTELFLICLSPSSVASEWVHKEIFLARANHRFIIPVMVEGCLDQLSLYDETKTLADIHVINFEGRYEEAFPELLRVLPGMTLAPRPEETDTEPPIDPATIPCPFKGLEAFQQTDAALFFGREDLVNKLLKWLGEDRPTRLLAVIGASGVGKSSLIRAGLIPKLRDGKLPGTQQWQLVIFTPGHRPTEAMATRLLPIVGQGRLLNEIVDALERKAEGLHQLVEGILAEAAPTSRLLLVVDQFEEVFTRASDQERDKFLTMLENAVTMAGGRTVVVLTMRGDFFDRLSSAPNLARLLEQENMLIATDMTIENLRSAIERPAKAVGLLYDENLVERILDEIRNQPGSLPLLQYALKELYLRREGRLLSQTAYDDIGGVRQALVKHAENVYGALGNEQQDIMRRVLLRLVEVSDTGEATRRRVAQGDLTFEDVLPEHVTNIIEELTAADTRLLIANREIDTNEDEEHTPTIWLEVSHEALITEWRLFKDWVRTDRDKLHFGSELAKWAQDWDKAGGDNAYLLRGSRLRRAKVWLESADADVLQRKYIEASVNYRKAQKAAKTKRQQRELELQIQGARRLRYLVAALVVFLVVASGLSLFAFQQRDEANLQARRNLASRLAQQTITMLRTQPQVAMLLGLAANDLEDTPETRGSLLAGLQFSNYPVAFLSGHTGQVTKVDFSPKDELLASSSADRTIRLWNVGTRQQVGEPLRGHEDEVTSVVFSPDGAKLASASADKTVRLWDLATRGVIRELKGHTEAVTSVVFSPDGTTLASASADGTVRLWDVVTGKAIGTPLRHGDQPVNNVAFSPNGRILASAGTNKRIMLWNVAEGRQIGSPLVGHGDRVLSLVFSPNGRVLLSSGADTNIRVPVVAWDLSAIEGPGQPAEICKATLYRHGEQVNSVAIGRNGRLLASASLDGNIYLLAFERQQITFRCGPTPTELNAPPQVISTGRFGGASSLAFHRDGNLLASGSYDGTIALWNIGSRQTFNRPLAGYTGRIGQSNVAFSPDDKVLAAGGCDKFDTFGYCTGGQVRVWDTASRRLLPDQRFLGHDDEVRSVAFSRDHKLLASASADKSIILWDRTTGKPIGSPLIGHTDAVTVIAFSPDSKFLASGSEDKTIRLWDVTQGQGKPMGQPLSGHAYSVHSLSFSPDSQQIASASCLRQTIGSQCKWGEVKRWDVMTGNPLKSPTAMPSESMNVVSFHPNGQHLAIGGCILRTPPMTGCGQPEIWLWDVKADDYKHKSLNTGPAPEGSSITNMSLDFSPDGKTLAAADSANTVTLWDMSDLDKVKLTSQSLLGYFSAARSVVFSPNGQMLAGIAPPTGGSPVVMWDMALRSLISQPFAITNPAVVSVVAVSPDSKLVASASTTDQAIRLLDPTTRDQVNKKSMTMPGTPYALAFSADGKKLISISCGSTVTTSLPCKQIAVRSWNVPEGEPTSPLPKIIEIANRHQSVAMNADGTILALAVCGKAEGDPCQASQIQLWDATTGQQLATLPGHKTLVSAGALIFSRDGSKLASGACAPPTQPSCLRTEIWVWDVLERKLINTLPSDYSGLPRFAFSPDGKLLASAECDRRAQDNSASGTTPASACYPNLIRVWDVATGKPTGQPIGTGVSRVSILAFSPSEGKTLAASMGSNIFLFDVETRQSLGFAPTGHRSTVNTLTFSPDGSILVSSATDNTIRRWEMESRSFKTPLLIGHEGAVTDTAITPDGALLASASADKTVRIWDIANRKTIRTLNGHTDAVTSVAISYDGKVLASASADKTVRLWDAATGKVLNTLSGHTDAVTSVAISYDGKVLASASADKTVRLWDVATGKLLNTLSGHTEAVNGVAFSPDGKLLASVSTDKTVRLWDVATGTPESQPALTFSGPAYSVAFSPDGRILAAGGCNTLNTVGGTDNSTGNTETCSRGEVRLWNSTSGQLVRAPVPDHRGRVTDIAFSPDNKTIASSSCSLMDSAANCVWGEIVLRDALTGVALGQTLLAPGGSTAGLVFSPNSIWLVSGSSDRVIRLWNMAGRLVSSQNTEVVSAVNTAAETMALSADGKTLAGSLGPNTRLWDMQNQQAIGDPLLGGTNDSVTSLALSPDGKLLASTARNDSSTIRLWNTANGQPIPSPISGLNLASNLAFNSDGTILAATSCRSLNLDKRCVQGQIRFWDAVTFKALGEPLEGSAEEITDIVFSPDGKLLAAASKDKTVVFWDVVNRTRVGELPKKFLTEVTSLAFSQDGTILATGSADAMITLWNVANRTTIGLPLAGHKRAISSLAFNKSGKLLASGDLGGVVLLWNVATGTQFSQSFLSPGRATTRINLIFNPTDEVLIMGGQGGITMVDADLQSWKAHICTLVNRNLTIDEWEQYLGKEQYKKQCPDLP